MEKIPEPDEELKKEIIKKFSPKREASELLSASYQRLGYGSKFERVNDCGTYLEFWRAVSDNPEKWRLHSANFCRDRLCPLCSMRRTYKIFGQISQIMDVIEDKYAFIFLTLTVPNCDAGTLEKTLKNMQEGFRKYIKYKPIKKAVLGIFKSLEITRNKKNGSYHPHYHNILAVDKNYFTSRNYIKRNDWLKMWQKAMKNSLITQVDVRKCKSKDNKEGEAAARSLRSAVAEVAKYSVKSVDYLIPDNPELTDDIVFTLSAALSGKRLCSFSGVFDEARKKLRLDDCENGDLIHTDNEKIRSDVAYMIRKYSWSCGAYKLTEQTIEMNVNIEPNENEDI